MVYLGVDLHRKRSVVTALAEDGTVMLSRRIASRPETFGALIEPCWPHVHHETPSNR